MTETNEATAHRSSRHGFWFGIALGGVLGAAIVALVAAAGVSAAPMASMAFHGRHGGHSLDDPERAKERVAFAAELVLGRIDATDDQKAEVRRIAERTIDAVVPLAQTHRANREALVEELTRPSIDRGAIETIRQSEVQLAESLSREVASSLADLAETLTPEQRSELLEMARRFHR